MAVFNEPLNGEVLRVFGEMVKVHKNGQSFELKAVFDDNYHEIDPGRIMISSSSPTLFTDEKNFSAAPGDEIEVRGHRYRVINVRRDSMGGALLELHRK